MATDALCAPRALVLLVEDEEPVRELVRMVLERNGYRVWQASDGVEALALYAAQIQAIDLLITDVLMPKMSGYELANRLLQEKPDLKIIFISGYTANAGSGAFVQPPQAEHLQKPFLPVELTQLIAHTLEA